MISMNGLQIALCTIVMFLVMQNSAIAQLVEATDPTVSHLEIVRGSGDPDYTGALNFEIPLMKIPGRGGLDYDLKLIYVHGNGVPAAESSSWAGLGWNLNLFQISCSPTYWHDPSGSDQVYSEAKDLYHLSYPGGSTAIYQFGSEWLPLDWKGIKIETKPGPAEPQDAWRIVQDYSAFIVTDLDGTRYIYADRLRQESALSLRNHCTSGGSQTHTINNFNHGLEKHPYYYVFKLSAITGPDYLDTQDPITDPLQIPDDPETDTGSWIRLQYSTPTIVRSEDLERRMEVNDLIMISTPTNWANFTVTMNNQFIYEGYTTSSQLAGRLDRIALGPNGLSIDFDYDSQGFSWVKPDQVNPGSGTLVKNGSGNGYDFLRTRLNAIRINNAISVPSYKFEYSEGPGKNHGELCGVDPWGYYTDDPMLVFPTEQQVRWGVWMLRQVKYPTGDIVNFEYESNRYQTYHSDWRGTDGDSEVIAGGMRLKKQTIWRGTGETLDYIYEYALTNERHPHFGFLSNEPMIFDWSPQYLLPTRNSVATNLRTEVHYLDVKITRPDGSRLCKYYTSAISGVYNDAHVPAACSITQPSDQLSYWRSYYNTTTLLDDEIQQFTNLGELYSFFDPPTNHEYYLLYFFPSEAYNTPLEAFRGEAKEFDDCSLWISTFCSGRTDAFSLRVFDNAWKRGRLTCEELYLPFGEEVGLSCDTPLERKIHHYTMDPIQTENYLVDLKCSGQLAQFPCFITSGWARLDKIDTYTRQHTGVQYLELTRSEEYEYNAVSGLVSKETVTGAGAGNQAPPRVTRTYYERESNDAMDDDLHMWSQKRLEVIGDDNSVFSSTPTANQDIASLTRTIWKTEGGRWVPDKTRRWLDANGDKDVAADEIETVQDYLIYDTNGNLSVVNDAKLTPTVILWGYSGSVPLAKCVNCNSAEFGFTGFEDGQYEGWNNVIREEFLGFTGDWTAVVHEYASGPNKVFRQTEGLRADVGYKASAWVNGYSGTVASLTICINGNTYVHSDQYSGSGGWELLEVELTEDEVVAGMNGDDEIKVYCSNNSDYDAYFDDIRFHRANALVTSWTYDRNTMQVESISDASNVTKKFSYDTHGRLAAEKDGEGNMIKEHSYIYSRKTTQDDEYDPANPNSIKTVAYGRQGLWESFEYTDSPTNHCWYVASGSGTVSTFFDATLQSRVMQTPTNSPPTNFDIRFPNPNVGTSCYSGTLDIPNPYLAVKIKDSNTFVLNVRIRATDQSEYNLVYTPEVGTPYATEENVYYYLGTEYQSGQWKTIERDLRKDFAITGLEFESVRWFLIEGDYDLDDLRLSDQSITTVAYYDGGGREIQTQTWFGDEDIISVKEYNAIGEIERAYHPQIIPNAFHRYFTSMVPFTEYEEFEYSHEPRARLSSQSHFDGTSIQYGFGFSISTPTTGRFERSTDENGNVITRVFDHDDRLTYEVLAEGTDDEIEWQQEFDILGNLTRVMPPNYFAPPSGSTADQWDIENSYDTLGRLIQKHTPDDTPEDGTTKYVYDLNGNLIYSQTAHQRDNDVNDYCYTVYFYDKHNRVWKISEETYQDGPDCDWIDGPAPPACSEVGLDIGEAKVRFTYDVNQVAGVTNYCQGKLTMTQINDDEDNAWEHRFRYVYDKYGRLVAKYILLDGGTPLSEKVIRYEYDRLGRLTTTVYPTGHRIMRIYDDAGRLKRIYNLQ